jgi:flagellin
MQVNTNMNSVLASNALASANKDAALAMQRISTTSRINSASDDPAGLVTATRLKTQIGSLTKANQNINSGIGALQVMDSTLGEISSILMNMKELAVSSNNGAASAEDRTANNNAFQEYLTQITSVSTAAKWNGVSLLASTTGISVRTGSATTDTQTIATYDTQQIPLGFTVAAAAAVDTAAHAATAEGLVDTAITTISGYQSKVGAMLNMMDTKTNVNNALITSNTTGYASITNADLATETANLASAQIRQNAASAMFAQSNTISKEIVSYLLKGL